MSKLLLGIDVGTSSVKVVATDRTGKLVADASQRYPTATDGAAAEQDAGAWWAAVCAVTQRVVSGREVAAVAVTSQAPTMVPVDEEGVPTAAALTWLDRRADVEARRIAEIVPQSRNGADPFFGTAKLPWLVEHRAEAMARAQHVLSANGFIVRRLSGVSVLDDTTAALMQGFDDESDCFDAALREAEPSLRYLPRIVPAAELVGRVTPEAASATGITAGAGVIAGGIDAIGSALEAGVLEPGDPLVDMTGFSSVTILPVPRGTRVPGFIHSRHCVPGVDLLITAQVTAGATVDWVNGIGVKRTGIDGTGADGAEARRDLRDSETLLARPRPGRLTMVPSLAGERTPSWNQHARGIIDGIDLAADGYDLMLAAMEGNAMALARDVATVAAAGFPVERVVSTGGGSSSRAWLQIKADVLGVPVHRPASGHGAAQGAAVLAGMAIGEIASLDTVRGLGSAIQASYAPDPRITEAYAGRLERFAELNTLNETRRPRGQERPHGSGR
ncbi:MAG: xylulokinase [Leucobacter sp.]